MTGRDAEEEARLKLPTALCEEAQLRPRTAARYLNINVAVMGHVDAGKTSLVRLLSQKLSTAALDKHPASRERGRTIDLGISCTRLDGGLVLPRNDGDSGTGAEERFHGIQLTWIDCPGHASLLRTVLLGASVMDLMLLVIDVTAGVQLQTLECLALGTIFAQGVVVALHKCDRLLDRESLLAARMQQVQDVLKTTRLPLESVLVVPTWIGPKARQSQSFSNIPPVTAPRDDCGGITELLEAVRTVAERALHRQLWAQRQISLQRPYALLAVDHRFEVTGQGTILTGILLTGRLGPGMAVQSALTTWTATRNGTLQGSARKGTLRIRSLQIYREPVHEAVAGDRVAIGLSLDRRLGRPGQHRRNNRDGSTTSGKQASSPCALESTWERGLIYAPPEALSCYSVDCLLIRIEQQVIEPCLVGSWNVCSLEPPSDIRAPFPNAMPSFSTQWQVTLALDTVPGRVTHWLRPPDQHGEYECVARMGDERVLSVGEEQRSLLAVLHLHRPVHLLFESAGVRLGDPRPIPPVPFRYALLSDAHWKASFSSKHATLHCEGELESEPSKSRLQYAAAVEAVLATKKLAMGETQTPPVQHLRAFRSKERTGRVERILDDGQSCLVRDLFGKDMQHPERMFGLRVRLEQIMETPLSEHQTEGVERKSPSAITRLGGRIVRTFGQRGKIVVQLDRPLPEASRKLDWLVRLRFRRPVSLGIQVEESAPSRHAIYQVAGELEDHDS
ncbi:hypothetical protein CCYA_CCYA02G0535 [Cyanidiococcus yangmingshanensis]|nr:hypothetical protein CCYA_CCYA02G0535 [Cyanidiococcus yangmingshanensis]